MDSGQIGKTLILLGAALVLGGAFLAWGPRVPFLGRLPGDIRVEKPGGSFYFPLTTCLLLSALGSFVLWLLQRHR
jgi:hypothetical protein